MGMSSAPALANTYALWYELSYRNVALSVPIVRENLCAIADARNHDQSSIYLASLLCLVCTDVP